MARIHKNNAVAVIVSALVIALLVLAGPAQGFSLALSLNNNNPTKGDKIEFTVELDIEAGENLPVELITLNLDGPTDRACQFDAEGNIIAGCDGMTVSRISYPSYNYGYGYGAHPSFGYGYFGYGYGYGPGKLAYKITLDTSGLQTGSYHTNFQVKIKDGNVAQKGPVFVVKSTSTNDDDDDDDDDDKPNGSCVTSYVCSEWSVCENGRQVRSCVKDTSYCYAGDMPEIERSCTSVDFENLSDNSGVIRLTNTSQNNISSPMVSRITGAVIGLGNTEQFNEDSLLFLVAVMVFVLALFTLLLIIRRGRLARLARERAQQKTFY